MPQVTLTYTFASEQEALDFLAGRNPEKGDKPAGKPAPKAADAGSPPSAGKKDAEKTAAPATPPAASPAPAPAEAAAPKYEDSGLPLLIKEAVTRDRAGVIALLKEFGAASGKELKPEQFDAFKTKIVKVGVDGDLA